MQWGAREPGGGGGEAGRFPESVGQGRYFLGRKLGAGSFGGIYACIDARDGKVLAAKLESASAKLPQLFYEAKLYKSLRGGIGIPKLHWHGVEGDYNVMILDFLGPSLEEAFNSCKRKFDVRTICRFGQQILERLQFMHDRDFVHRDLKPRNFLMGVGNDKECVHMIDYGLCKRYRDVRTGEHIPLRKNKITFTGNAVFASVTTHLGVESSRRDDLESLAYLLVYFHNGCLPWSHCQREQIAKVKLGTRTEELCYGCPPEFAEFLKYTRRLGFEEQPEYAYLHDLLEATHNRHGLSSLDQSSGQQEGGDCLNDSVVAGIFNEASSACVQLTPIGV